MALQMVGKKIGDRKVITAKGTQSFSSLMGKKGMVLYFYPKDATPGCTQEACDFRDSYSKLQKLGYSVVGVSPDSVASHERFVLKQSLTFDLISDTDQELAIELGVWAEKKMYGRTYMGIVRSTFILDKDRKIQHVISPVKVKGHVDSVIDWIQANTI